MRSNRILIITLIGLGIVIIGLIVGIVIVSSKKPSDNNGAESNTSEDADNCLSVEPAQRGQCNVDKLAVGEYDEIEKSYDDALQNAFSQQDYTAFTDLTREVVSLFASARLCDKSLRFLDDARIDKLPVEERATLYSYTSSAMIECNNTEKYDELQAKLQALHYDENGNLNEAFLEPVQEGDEDE